MRLCSQILNFKQISRLPLRSQHRQTHGKAAILSIGTGNPKHKLSKKDARHLALSFLKNKEKQSVVESFYSMPIVDNRYVTIHPDYLKYIANKLNGDKTNAKRPEHLTDDECLYPEDGSFKVELGDRLALFQKVARPLAIETASRAIEQAGINPMDIGKIILSSNTGFQSPGIECDVIRDLQLRTDIERTFIGLSGCAGGIHGLQTASDFVQSKGGKKALVVCAELNSLHANYEDSLSAMGSHVLMGDGIAAAVVGTADDKTILPRGTLKLVDRRSLFVKNTSDAFALNLGPNGMIVSVSKTLPATAEKEFKPFVNDLLTGNNLSQKDIDFWGLDVAGPHGFEYAQEMGVTKEGISDSVGVMRDYGSMGSSTIMFVLDRIVKKHKAMLAEGQTGLKRGIALALGPGLKLEGILMEMV